MLQGLRSRLSLGFFMSMLAACGGATATTVGSGASSSGCGSPDSNGLNENQQAPGDKPDGVAVGMGDIAVAPGGDFVVFTRGDELAVGIPATGEVHSLPVTSPTRLAFAKGRPVVYVGSGADNRVHAVDVQARTTLWTAPLSGWATFMKIASTQDDTRVVATLGSEVLLLDAEDGAKITAVTTERPIVDLDILPDDARALVVTEHVWQDGAPTTELQIIELEAGAARAVEVPNCSDNIVIAKGGARALLAPTTCNEAEEMRDPISVVDLAPGAEQWNRNLPGFGPVALGPDGTTAVGFLDAENIDPELFDDPAQIPELSPDNRYHLMVLDTEALTYVFHPAGLNMPRYAMTPDGQVLLVDSLGTEPARLFDTATGTFRAIEGASLLLDNFALTSDSTHAYVLQMGLWDLDIAAAKAASIPLDFVPVNINITPDDRTLFLRETDTEVCVFSLATRECGSYLSTTPPAL